MNTDQRKYLIGEVEKNSRTQIELLQKAMPDKPSLNNYLIASFLDNSIQFASIEVLKDKMRKSVLKLGSGSNLVHGEKRDRFSRYNDNDDETEVVHIKADELFVIPKNYLDALKEYEEKKKLIDEEVEKLRATTQTIIMKIQLGSSATMDKLIMQIDNMGDLNLVNTQLMLGEGGSK